MHISLNLFVAVIVIVCVNGAPSYLCSAYCPSSCNGIASNNCLACTPGSIWAYNAGNNTCGTVTNYQVVATPTNFTISNPATTTCGSYTGLYGTFGSSTITLTTTNPITAPHYEIIFYAWVVLIDGGCCWYSSDYIRTTLSGNTIYTYESSYYQSVSSQCGGSSAEQMIRISALYSHTSTTATLQFSLYGSYSPWAMKQMMIVAHLCHPYCSACTSSLVSACSACNTGYYYYTTTTTCYTSCPSLTTISSSNPTNCIACNVKCLVCSGTATNCSSCVASYSGSPVYFVPDTDTCTQTCPAGYYPHTPSLLCLKCPSSCATLSISSTQYFLNNTAKFILTFSLPMDWSTFSYASFATISIDPSSTSYSLSSFTISSYTIDSYSYALMVNLNTGASIEDGTIFNILTKTKTANETTLGLYQVDSSAYQAQGQLNWIGVPKLPYLQRLLINNSNSLCNSFISSTSSKYIQQFKKSGVFTFLASAVQLPSVAILHSSIHSQSFYAFERLWSQFVYFDVPLWMQNSSQTLYTFSKQTQSIINSSSSRRRLQTQPRLLQQSSSSNVYWNFGRTGQTGYFLFDNYIQLILISLSWLIVGLFNILMRKWSFFKRRQQLAYLILHKAHEVTLFYIVMGVVLDYTYFDPSDTLRWISFSLSVLTILYFLIYDLRVFYSLIVYPGVSINTNAFKKYSTMYGYFLDDIRYEQYKEVRWSPAHMLRPYNYRILYFYKRILIVAAMPIFYSFPLAQGSSLIILQALDIVRFLLTIPFASRMKNIVYGFLEVVLFIFFLLVMVHEYLGMNLLDSNSVPITSTYLAYYQVGRAATIFLFFYNISYLFLTCIQLILICKCGPKERMQNIRKEYYQRKLQQFEEFGSYYRLIKEHTPEKLQDDVTSSPIRCSCKKGYLSWINNLHDAQPIVDIAGDKSKALDCIIRKGNLLDHPDDQLQTIPIPIQEYHITRTSHQYNVEYVRSAEIYLSELIDYEKKNNTELYNSIRDNCVLRKTSGKYFHVIDQFYKKYAQPNTKSIILKTFLVVDQDAYLPGQQIVEKIQNMKQKVYLIQGKKVKSFYLSKVLDGFPVPIEQLLALN